MSVLFYKMDFNYLVNNISLGRGLGFISLLRRALCSDDKDGNFPDDTTDADDTLEFGRLWKEKNPDILINDLRTYTLGKLSLRPDIRRYTSTKMIILNLVIPSLMHK